MKYTETTFIPDAVVKLTFKREGKLCVGTGFFIRIPESPYEVILTAGHNLYTSSKTFTTSLTVLLPNPNPCSALPVAIRIPNEKIRVCARYLKDPTNPIYDYGAILISRTDDLPVQGSGFGFNLMHSFLDIRGMLYISGYRTGSYPGRPVLSGGGVLNHQSSEHQLVYSATGQTGGEGSPVWVVDNDNDNEVSVVGIHLHDPAPGSQTSTSCRLYTELLCEVYSWADLNNKKRIAARNLSKQNPLEVPSTGLYMVFGSKPFARLRRGTGSEFSVFPVHVWSSGVRYALVFGSKWVTFDIEDQKITLADRPSEQCLFVRKPMKNAALHPNIFYIALKDNHLLRMDGSKFKPIDTPDAQKTGLGMVSPYDRRPFIQFAFEPVGPSNDA